MANKVLLTHCNVPPPVTKAEPGQVPPRDYPPGAVVLIHRFAAAPCTLRSVAKIPIDVCVVRTGDSRLKIRVLRIVVFSVMCSVECDGMAPRLPTPLII